MSLQEVPGSYRRAWPGTVPGAAVDPEQRVRLTVWFARGAGGDDDAREAARLGALPVGERTYESRSTFSARSDASEEATHHLTTYCRLHGIDVLERHWRSATVAGRLGDLVTAFDADVDIRTSPNGSAFRHRKGWLSLPLHLAQHVRGVFGFHEWCRDGGVGTPRADRVPLEPHAIARRYGFPEATGAGQTIGILAYDATYRESDYERAMERLGIRRERPALAHVDGERPAHRAGTGADLEAATDVQIAAQLAPGARIVVYEAPHGERGCLDAIRTAIFDDVHAPSVLSISYGIIERNWSPAALAILDDLFVAAALIGVTVLVASGDNGPERDEHGNAHVNAPASSPFALACGATVVHRDARGDFAEIAWHHSGGGFGRAAVPAWQAAALGWAERHGIAHGRGVPDVAAQCDPGYLVYFNGTELSMHGTSTIAPMWAALVARINERAAELHGRTAGFFAPLLYARADGIMRAIVRGRNELFEAGDGWNPLAGLGVPDGKALEAALVSPQSFQHSRQSS